jgi:anti-anti-sigma factor
MKLEYNELDNGIRVIKLIGRLDMAGTNLVERQVVQHCAGENVFVLVDLSEVNYLSSIGIPMLISNAKGVASRGGRMAFLNPQTRDPMARKLFLTSIAYLPLLLGALVADRLLVP